MKITTIGIAFLCFFLLFNTISAFKLSIDSLSDKINPIDRESLEGPPIPYN